MLGDGHDHCPHRPRRRAPRIRESDARHDRPQQVARLRRIQEQFDTLPDIFYVTDEDGRLVRFNDRLSDVTGYTEDELDSIYLLDLIPQKDRDRFEHDQEELSDTDDIVTMESWLVTKDGEHIPYEFRRRQLVDPEGGVFGFAEIARDITERKRYERQLEQHIDRLNEFARVLTHDLRNPLSVVKEQMDTVADDVGETHTINIESVNRSLDRIEDIIDDVLEITRTGLPVTEPEATDISALARRTWEDMAKGPAHPDLTCEDIPSVMADPSLLERLLMNLFRNAVEHGGREVVVRVGPLDDGFYVEDDGPGIPPEGRESIFDWKYTTKAEDSGIGLKSVEQIVDAHGWGISLTESGEGGARFEITGVEFADR
ncbi:MAG: PAS domain S-box protein [Halolamina sp.]